MATVAERMTGTKGRLVAALGAALVLAPAAHAGGPGMIIGATEDAVRAPTLVGAKAKMTLVALAGFNGVRITQTWKPGETVVSPADKAILRNVTAAARLSGIQVLTSVMNAGSATTPLTPQDQADFAAYAASVVRADPDLTRVIVGNEPNLNRYWLPQFNADGSDAAAPAYEALLAQTYDAIKAVAPNVTVIGGAVSPRGSDNPKLTRQTHSPTGFITDLGTAYRASGRTTPIMDAFAFHPYEDDSSVAPATGVHPNSTTIALADYGKVVSLLGIAFDGTAQAGSTLPIYYDEFGGESQMPAAKQGPYPGTEPATTKPVDEATQAAYYRQAIQLAFCQPNVRGIFLFHAFDETALAGWQSGLFYADGTPKTSLAPVRQAMGESRRGVVAACPGLRLTPKAAVTQTGAVLTLSCNLDCAYTAQLYRLPGKLLATKRGRATGGLPARLALRVPVAKASYRLRISLTAPVNPGRSTLLVVPLRRG
jgi:hypothetical protein